MKYRVLFRKYRPSQFKDVIGQDVLVKTIQNAIRLDQVGHAFLLSGIRGTGKTSTARLIAKVVNCENVTEDIEACGSCQSCKLIKEGKAEDIVEIDAATNTSVDNIREIIENSRYRPIFTKYKIYIIDEVHMLSMSAFNALLKILEEPPVHVKFILATTEIQKVPATIISRCQRFLLKRIASDELLKLLKDIAISENKVIDDESLKIIVRSASGSARDAISQLEQVFMVAPGKVNVSLVKEVLGLENFELIERLVASVLSSNYNEVIKVLKELFAVGEDPTLILQKFLTLVHNITRYKNIGSVDELTEDEKKFVENIAVTSDITVLSRIWQILENGYQYVEESWNPYKSLEMIFVKVINTSKYKSVDDIINSLSKKKT